ncbi:hypothetical protein ES708_09272 [subsurface metagenome]
MVEIRYGERYEMADLAGRSIADAREQYKQEFGIPDKAQASLNSKGIGKKHEPMTALGDNDSLTFAEKSRKGLFFIGAILLALAITGGIFAYGATTATVTLGLIAKTDFAEVVAASPTVWNVWGSYKGRVPAGDLFTITPEASVPADSWTGDMSVTLTIANSQDLVEAYKMLVFEIEVWDDVTAAIATGSTTEYLTLGKGDIDIDFEQGAPAGTYTVKIISGYYITHKGGWTDGKEDPLIMCQVLQREAP